MKRISWRRGMRLSDDLLRASDDCTIDMIRKVGLISSGGMFGLLPAEHPFEISLNFGKDCIDIDSLSCRAVARDGSLIDLRFHSRFDNSLATRVMIPALPGVEEYLLVVEAAPNQWKPTGDGMEEPTYFFSLINADAAIPAGGMPIARIVDDYGWRLDETDFVPPCMFVAVHPKFAEQLAKFAELLSAMDNKARAAIGSGAHAAVAVFWPLVQQISIDVDKKRDFISPMELMGKIQQCVSAYTCACELNPELATADLKMFRSFALAPYTVKEAYTRIRIGLEICNAIVGKVAAWAGMSAAPKVEFTPPPSPSPAAVLAPAIDEKNTQILCSTSETTVPVLYSGTSAAIHFTIDGSIPTKNSPAASRTRSGYRIKFDNGFRQGQQDSNKTVVLNMVAFDGGGASNVASYSLSLSKDLRFRNAIPI